MLRDSVLIRANAAEIWRIVGDPQMSSLWNPRVRSVNPATMGSPREGARYRVTVRFGGRDSTSDLEIVDYEPLRQMCTVMTGGRLKPGERVVERWTLEEENGPGSIRLHQEVDLSDSGIPWLWRTFMTLLHRFGRPVGVPHLQVLAELVERGLTRPTGTPPSVERLG